MGDGRSVLDRLPDGRSNPVAVLVGAAVTVVLSFLPFSPVIGGAVAAERATGGERTAGAERTVGEKRAGGGERAVDGERVEGGYVLGFGLGLLAGAVAAVPLGALLGVALWIVRLLGVGVAPSAPAYEVFLAVVGLFFLAYTVGCSALGGLVGVWIGRHTDRSLSPQAWT